MQPLNRAIQESELSEVHITYVGGYAFASVVHDHFHWRARLNILMLRPGDAGFLLKTGGDINNRLRPCSTRSQCQRKSRLRALAQILSEDAQCIHRSQARHLLSEESQSGRWRDPAACRRTS
jgi:hypothetical protein